MRRLLLLLLFGLGLSLLAAPGPGHAVAQETSGQVVALTIDGPITPVVARYIERGLRRAQESGARAVVIRMDTPGGLDGAMREIIQNILASQTPVITYVAPEGARAASAGAFISYAAHVAAMAPSTTIGSASPVSVGGGEEQAMSDTMTAKVTNDAVSLIRGLAERNGRNADWAEQAVREAANLTAAQAIERDVVDIVAVDMADLLRQADGRAVALANGPGTVNTRDATINEQEPHWIEAFLQLIADPTVAYLLLSLALLGLYLEFMNPGSILPGVAGAILLVLALFSLGSLPVNWAGVLLMALALALFAGDIWLGGSGLLSIGGVIAFVLGSLLLIDVDAAPGFEISPIAIAIVTLGLAASAVAIGAVSMRDRQRRPTTGREGLVGAIGITHTALEPGGLIFIEGERWSAVSQDGLVPAGQPVRVLSMQGLTLLVTPALETSPPSMKEQRL